MRLPASVLVLALAAPLVAADPPTFHKNVAPILFANCTTCHRAGEIGPFPLLTFTDANGDGIDDVIVSHDWSTDRLPRLLLGGKKGLSAAQIGRAHV